MNLDDTDTITPTAVRIAPPIARADTDAHADADARTRSSSAAVTRAPAPPWFLFAGLTFVALITVWLLPGSNTSNPQLGDVARRADSGPVAVPTARLNTLTEAQRLRRAGLRHLAGDALDELVRARAALKLMRVTVWEPVLYRFAEQEAARGEAAFRRPDYNAATFHYRNAGQAFNALLVAGQQLRQGAIAATWRALATGDAVTAGQQLARALQVGTSHADLAALQARVKALPKVLAFAARGDAALDAGDVQAARREYQAALGLDPQFQPARTALAHLATQAAQQQYLSVMSQGYTAMQRHAFDAARAAFERARTMHPDRSDADLAMVGLTGTRTTSTLEQLQESGARLLADERFAEATQVYAQALAIDRTLAFATRGAALARERQQLLQALDNTVAHPERQSADDAHKAAQALRDRVVALPDKGALLQGRLAALDTLLARAAVQVTVTLLSDDVTQVRLFRIGVLGRFTQKQVDLRPGRYTAIGVRDGYRDTRRVFDVAPNMQPVTVRCEEAIQ